MSEQADSLYGLSAEFTEPEALLRAAKAAKAAGYQHIKTFSPYRVAGLAEELGHRSSALGWIVLVALILGAVGAFALQYWTGVVHYPLNVGGRPFFSWPAFIPITFETAILFAGLATVGFMFILSGFPVPYHPIFNVPGIEAASRDRFFLCILVQDSQFHLTETRDFLQSLEPVKVSEVPC